MDEYVILSEIYKILGNATVESLERIEQSINQPDAIMEIVKAFKNAKKNQDIANKQTVSDLESPRISNWSSHSTRLWKNLKSTLLHNNKIKNQDIIDAFKTVNLNTSARKKEGKEKIVAILESSLHKVDEPTRIKMLEEVATLLDLDQTKGFIDAIRSKANSYY